MAVPPRLVLGLLLTAASCDEQDAPAAAPGTSDASAGTDAKIEVLDVSFSELYRVLLRRNLSIDEKAVRWASRYNDRWVRWTGVLVTATGSGVKMRQLQGTLTYDVSVIINQPQRAQLGKLVTPGKFYTYMGRLSGYDDLFRTLSLDHGVILDPSPKGVTGELAPLPPPLRIVPGPLPEQLPTQLPGEKTK